MGTIVRALSFLTLQRENALRDALRHGTADCGLRCIAHAEWL
ncbi:DUF1534 domain-containing protein [Pseudomonas syringae]|nr:DUF1534 domain-containing protein [Pseudomonas syringae]MCF5742875.1 DUF1534 domain-containing protein [Pseudomonas syringae]MCF5752348.1 DUF1534 domain-containing protein [Pseudomonas syringae]MCF5756774.1 DUF1534 domain-containing protein [Pseudomonas syringae]